MKLREAIKILENDPPRPHPLNRDEFEEAYQLGIEALKAVKYVHRNYPDILPAPLPGETPEETEASHET